MNEPGQERADDFGSGDSETVGLSGDRQAVDVSGDRQAVDQRDKVQESAINAGEELRKRRSSRIVQAMPLTVTGVDALGRPFQERTSSLIINCHGCRYLSKHYVLKNMWVTFEVPHSEPGRNVRSVRARVTWIQRPRTVRELFQIGVELEVSGNIWGIAFPQADWFSFPEPAAPPLAAPVEQIEAEPAGEDWISGGGNARPAPGREEDNLHVLP